MRKRRSVEVIQTGGTRLGPKSLLRITYTDGFVSWACSVPGSLALFGSDYFAACREFLTSY